MANQLYMSSFAPAIFHVHFLSNKKWHKNNPDKLLQNTTTAFFIFFLIVLFFFWYLFLIISNCFLTRSTQIKTYSWDNAQVVLAGNKCDMEEERVVSVDSGRLLAEQLGKSVTNIHPYVISVGWCFCDLLAFVLPFVYGRNQQSILWIIWMTVWSIGCQKTLNINKITQSSTWCLVLTHSVSYVITQIKAGNLHYLRGWKQHFLPVLRERFSKCWGKFFWKPALLLGYHQKCKSSFVFKLWTAKMTVRASLKNEIMNIHHLLVVSGQPCHFT